MGTRAEELLKKMKNLEAGHAELRDEVSKLMISGGFHRRRMSSDVSPPGYQLKERQCLNILESMGHSIHIMDSHGRVFYWTRSAENLYGYSPTEAIGRTIFELLVSYRDVPFAEVITQRCSMGETWTGKWPVTDKMGQMFTVFVTNTPLYDDDGTFIGIICLSNDPTIFKDSQVSISDPVEEEMGKEFSTTRSSVTTRFGLDPDQPLKTAISSKITNLASKVRNKVRAKMKTGESNVFRDNESGNSRLFDACGENGNSGGASTLRGDSADTPAGVFSSFASGKPPAHAQRETVDDSEGKPGIHKMITTAAEAWICKKAMQWSGKGTKCEPSNSQSGQFELDACSSESDSSSAPAHKLDAETTSLGYEIMWEDLTVGEKIGQGSCGTVYHGLWYGSDVAIKVFSKQEYSEEVILSFKQEVFLMKLLRHPNILLFMGAVTSPQRLCIGKRVPPAAEGYIQTRLETTNSYGFRHSQYSGVTILLQKLYLRFEFLFMILVDVYGSHYPQWMAPEVLHNERSNEKSDLYSFGVVLWELATQKIPWENLNAMQVIAAVGFMNQRLDIPEDVDPMWASMIESCWRSEPQSRPTFQELVEKLKGMQKKYAIQSSQAARASASADVVPPKQLLISDVH
ncbi:hypothetical protein KSS87_016279 [Heliosperma pusillum]|nr:hypothetical protein KSS87_016279 [Heliosperma pusillum]